VLSGAQVESFIAEGFLKLEHAFPRALADEGRTILWRDTGCDPDNPQTWTKPVVRLGLYGDAPFAAAANTPRLHGAFDQLVAAGCWLRRPNLGTFPVRFPSAEDPGDTGWHIDVSFRLEHDDANDFRCGRRRCADAHPGGLTSTWRECWRAPERTA
jgi:hypothetical protein